MAIIRAKTIDLFSYNDLTALQIKNSDSNNDEIKNKSTLLTSHPKRLILELTNACNLDCIMCGRDESEFTQTFFDINLLPKFEKIFHSIEEVTLFGWGEPTMHPKFKEFLQFFNHYPVKKYFVTNGMFLHKFIDDIFDNHVDIIAVSLDGAEQTTNNDIRLKSDFDKILDNIKKLVEFRNKKQLKYPHINFVMTLMKDNIEQLPDMVVLAHQLGIEEVKAVYLTGFNLKMSEQTLWNEQEKVREIFKKSEALAKKYNLILKLPHIQGEDPANSLEHKPCYVAWRDFFIGSDGYIRPCQSTSKKFFHHRDYPCFDEMWNSHEYQSFRDEVNDENKMSSECHRCYQSSNANWNKESSFIQHNVDFAPVWLKEKKKRLKTSG